MHEVKRVRLPSGGWWDILTRPRWRDVRRWDAESEDLIDQALVSLTSAWSFDDEVGLESLERRDAEDVAVVLRDLLDSSAALFTSGSAKETAEELFAGLMAGRVPSAFAEAALMASTGWDWHTLQETPADVVERMWVYLSVRRAIETRGVLNFDGE